MSIQATCVACGKTYSVPDKYAGKSLACKECGETFEVQGEDDFDAPPQRPRRGDSPAPARSPTKKPGKKRRKSGPNWLLIGLGGAGGLLVVGGLIWFLVSMLSTTHESLVKDDLDHMEDMVSILESVKDTASAEAAVPRIRKLGDRMTEHYRQVQRLKESDPLTEEEQKALTEKYKERKDALQERLSKERSRVQAISGVIAILQEPMNEISQKMADVRREESDRKLEARGIDPEKARQEMNKQMEEFHQKQLEKAQAASQQSPVNSPTQNNPQQARLAVTVRMSEASNLGEIEKRLREISGPTQVFHTMKVPQGHVITIAPMTDLDGFTNAVDFGKITDVNRNSRMVLVEPDANYTFKPGGPVAANGSKSN